MQVFVAYGAVSSTLDYTSKGSWGQHQTDLWFGVWIQSVTPGTQAAHWHLSSMKSDSRHVPSAILWRGLRPTRVDGYRARAAVSTLTEGLLFLFIFYKLLRWIQWDNETTLPVQPTYIICTHMYTQAHIQPSSALHGVVHQRQAAGFLFPLFHSSTKPVTSLWRRDARNLILLCLRNHPLCAVCVEGAGLTLLFRRCPFHRQVFPCWLNLVRSHYPNLSRQQKPYRHKSLRKQVNPSFSEGRAFL